MKRSYLLSGFALGFALLSSSCGGSGGSSSSSSSDAAEEATVIVTEVGVGDLSGAKIVSSTNDWPSGSTENQVVIVSLELGDGISYSDGSETGTVVDFICLAMSAETGLADMKFNLPTSYSYDSASGQLILHSLDVFGSGSMIDVVLQLTADSDTSMNASMLSTSTATDSSSVSYEVLLLDDNMTLQLEGHIEEEEEDSGSTGDDGVAPILF